MSEAVAFYTKVLINNEERNGRGAPLRIVSPVTEAIVVEFPGASIDDVRDAVSAAKTAFESGIWADPMLRRTSLLRLADLIMDHRQELMDVLISEIGTPSNLIVAHVDGAADLFRYYGEAAMRDRTVNLGFNANFSAVNTIHYRPVGVVAAITAFNYPLAIGAAKLGAALAAGCTAVFLSSPLAPLATLLLGKLVREAGIPAGVLNVVAGGVDVGQALTQHEDVAKITFTGSVNVGKQVMAQASDGLRGVVLELGGKAPAVMLPSADLNKYSVSLHARYARNAGQGCGSPTRIIVEESRYEEFCEISRKAFESLKVGDPRAADTVLGPLVTSAQRDRVERVVAEALERGATMIAGGGRPAIDRGWYVNPMLIGGVDRNDPIVRQEIFGPVSVVLTYKSVEEAIEIANDTDLGLKGYIFGDLKECLKWAPKMKFGTVQVNGGSSLRAEAPMIGYGHSGLGAERGEDGLREFLVLQHIDVPVA